MRLGFDDASVSVRAHAKLRDTLPAHVELVPAAGVVEAERAIKEPGEVETLRAAAALADDIYAWVLEHGLVGRTEREVAVALEHEMRVRGASGPSFPSIVASGAHGALPHAQPRDVEIPHGTLVTIDIGARLDGYCSDCTRTFATGSRRTTCWRPTRSSCAPRSRRSTASGPARGPRGRCAGPRHHRGGRPRRALRPQPRARRRAGAARGAAARARRRRRVWRPGTW